LPERIRASWKRLRPSGATCRRNRGRLPAWAQWFRLDAEVQQAAGGARACAGAFTFCARVPGGTGDGSGGGLVGFEIFEPELELFDVVADLFRARSEVHPLELENEQVQVLDLSLFGEHESFERLVVEPVEIETLFFTLARAVDRFYCRNYVTPACRWNEDLRTFSRRDVRNSNRRRCRLYRPSPVDAFQQHRELRAAQ
jgi:hypothetical protein